ncbi:CVNH domain protein [Ceratocystis platani]|uniref:CVNH domain protein n=1 Tax=Ceratocystis fimbriata f. sp. platani TaxID=88771 RepID=A0A0F8B4H5_CERFI|nr:CVNH domain protein [Ceratocystis platani]
MRFNSFAFWLSSSIPPALGILGRPVIDRGDMAIVASYYPCHHYYLDSDSDGILWSTCPDIDEKEAFSSLDLNRCLINKGGKLEYIDGGGDAMQTCSDCSLAEAEGYYPRIKCQCRTGDDDDTKKTTLDLSKNLQ